MSSQPTWMRRTACLAVAAAMALWACDGPQEPGPTPHVPEVGVTTPRPLLARAVVSNPVAPPLGTAPGTSSTAYVSLPPGSVANAELATIANPRTGARVTAAMVEGGLDPVAVEAAAGDTLDLDIRLIGIEEQLLYSIVVPDSRPPVVVRTDPPPKKRDVPLNAVLFAVFSEPMAAASLTHGSVQLLLDGEPVAGTLAFADDAHVVVRFTPAAPLAAGGPYTLALSQTLADLDGETLANPVTIDFQAAGGSQGISGVYERVSPVSFPGQASRYVFYDDGRFDLQYETEAWGAFAYSGQYWRWRSTIDLVFDANAGEWWASGTLQGDSLVVEYNVDMQLSDFEDGVYVRMAESGEGWTSLASMPGPRWQLGATTHEGRLYVAGGVADQGAGWAAPPEILAYDTAAGTWQVAGELLHPVRGPGVAAVGDSIYILGGCLDDPWNPIANVQIFDPATGTVVEGPPLLFGRCGAAVTVLDGRLHVIGGTYKWADDDVLGERTDAHEVLDPAVGTWSSLAPLPRARSGHGAVAAYGKIYVGGGFGEGVLQVYDPATDSWSLLSSPVSRYGTAATAIGGKVVFFGGSVYPGCCVGTQSASDVDRFDPATGVWDRIASMSLPSNGHGVAVAGPAAFVIGGSTGGAAEALAATHRIAPQ